MPRSRWFFVAILSGICFYTINGIRCYRCKSNEDIYCAEKFDLSFSTLTDESCDDIFEARYCIKTTGMYGGEIGTRRFCSARDHGNYCEYIRRPGDEWEYRSCVYTCQTDGCNGVGQTPVTSGVSLLAASSLVLALQLFWNR